MKAINTLPVADLTPSPLQYRKTFAGIEELAESIKSVGVLQRLVVRAVNGHHEIVCGERRWRAAKVAGLAEVPVDVRELTDVQVRECQLTENASRADVHPLEEADAYQALHRDHGYAVEDIAAKVGKSRSHIYGRLRLCDLPAAGRKALLDDKISASTALLIARMPTEETRAELLEFATRKDYAGNLPSYRDVETHVHDEVLTRLKDATFDPKDAELVPSAGACPVCPKRTGAQVDLFPDVKSADVCTDPACFEAKAKAHAKRAVAQAHEKGLKVLEGKAAAQARYGGGFVDPAEKCWDDPKRRTYKQLVGKAAPDPVVILGERGEVTERWDKAAVTRALKDAGHAFAKKIDRGQGQSAAEKRRRAEQDRQREVDRAVMERIVDAITQEMDEREDLLRAAAAGMVRFAWADVRKTVARRRALVTGKQHCGDADRALQEQAKTLEYSAAIALLVELLLGHDIYDNKATTKAVCAAAHVDPKAVEKELRAAAKAGAAAKKAAKTKPAKAAKPKPGTCRVCSCTEDHACEGGCSWADKTKTICTRCDGGAR